MKPYFEVISGYVVSPSTTPTMCTPATGDSFTLRKFSGFLLTSWDYNNAAGVTSIKGISFKNWIDGLYYNVPAALVLQHLPLSLDIPTLPSDMLEIRKTGTAAVDTIELMSFLMYYPNTDFDTNYITLEEYNIRRGSTFTISNRMTASNNGCWNNDTPFLTGASGFPAVKENKNYAIIGFMGDTPFPSFGLKCKATSYARTGFWCDFMYGGDLNREYFLHLAKKLAIPAIPVVSGEDLDRKSVV
jgi:hypothetical protein